MPRAVGPLNLAYPSGLIVANRAGAHGLAIRDGKVYIATVKEVFTASINADGTLGPLEASEAAKISG